VLWDDANGANAEAVPVLDIFEKQDYPSSSLNHGSHFTPEELLVVMG